MRSAAKSAVRATFAVLALVAAVSATPARAEKRLALVVGNNAYESVPKLEKAVNDAKAVSSSLQSLGFQVQLATDLNRRDFIRQLSAFMDKVSAGDLALIYYAGHGIEVRGVNYILPTDIPPVKQGQESLLTGEAVQTEKIITDLQDRGARASVFVLDACRDNPFKTGTTRSLGGVRGLAQGTPPEGVFVLYSAGVGQAALDRMSDSDADPNSVFTRVFLKEVQKKENTLVAIAKSTQVAVRDLSLTVSHTQVPAYYDQIIGQLYLASDGAAPAKSAQEAPVASNKPARPPVVASLPPQPSQPKPSQPVARAVFNNRAFNDFLKRQPQMVRADLANPNAVANCDRLASYGSDVPDSRAPRVRRDDIRVKEALPACVAAILQEPGTPRLRAQLARALLDAPAKRDKVAGLDMLLDLAKDGYPAAMWRIGICYYGGELLKENKRAAAFWFRQAADKGLGAAMSDLAYLYERGEGVEKDGVEAARWFERAAAGGHPGGMRNYALVLDQGEAVPRNPKQSAEYLLTAFRMGSPDARESLFKKHASWQADTRAQVQELLREFGFQVGRTDGEFDGNTFTALEALRASNPINAGRVE
ncbi:caspase family protein [Bradyrhizobium sp. JYMT SZCCT0180]|uniref:caspase family protein n=1 Tax=Bradyrhizobium sp. JYMT SZCCT0180 TaxID=2807666 RepID=UPI001BA7154F|nr:caspase family protein [Bradyrhizobium sp. JYMT SZCCT0180]MBR1212498.1 caspase family protein [Bradyrhizobium sp. JYMT SZCCT0180]